MLGAVVKLLRFAVIVNPNFLAILWVCSGFAGVLSSVKRFIGLALLKFMVDATVCVEREIRS